jgi:hypothetical protein
MPLKKVSKPLEKIFGLPSLSRTFQFLAQLTRDIYADLSKKIELAVPKISVGNALKFQLSDVSLKS